MNSRDIAIVQFDLEHLRQIILRSNMSRIMKTFAVDTIDRAQDCIDKETCLIVNYENVKSINIEGGQ